LNTKEIINKDNKKVFNKTNGVNVFEKSNAEHMTNKERFSMMMNKKKNKSKKRKVQLAWELMSKLLELVESTKRVGEWRWVRP
jgi:hypothetical protein